MGKDVYDIASELRLPVPEELLNSLENVPIQIIDVYARDKTPQKIVLPKNHDAIPSMLESPTGFSYGKRIFTTIFGRTESGIGVSVIVKNHTVTLNHEVKSKHQGEAIVRKVSMLILNPNDREDLSYTNFAHSFVIGHAYSDQGFVSSKTNSNVPEKKLFVVIEFPSLGQWYKARDLKGFEFGFPVDPTTQLFRKTGLKPSLYFKTRKATKPTFFKPGQQRYTSSTLEVETDVSDLEFVPNDSIANCLCIGFDIEQFSEDGSFPDPLKKSDCIMSFQLSFSYLSQFDTKTSWKNVVIYNGKTCVQIEEAEVVHCTTEAGAIEVFRDYLIGSDADFLLSYNGARFDNRVTITRPTKILETKRGSLLSKFLSVKGSLREYIVTLPGQVIDCVDMGSFGFVDMDLYFFFRKNYSNLRSYKLDTIAQITVGENKLPLSAKEMFKIYREQNEEGVKFLLQYGCKDGYLMIDIAADQHIIEDYFEKSRASITTLKRMLQGGPSKLCENKIIDKCHERGYVVGHFAEKEKREYTGAVVLDAVTGNYGFCGNRIVAVFDFMALYPSIMIAHNVCTSTLIDASRPVPPDCNAVCHMNHTYVQSHEGIIPSILRELGELRNNAKKLKSKYKKEGNNKMHVLMDKRQLSLKVLANSMYGFEATKHNFANCAIAETTTFLGRQGIEQTRDIGVKILIEMGFVDASAIYGDTDSVFLLFGIQKFLHLSREEMITKIFELCETIAAEITKTFKEGIVLEFEKIYWRFILMAKKRYAGYALMNGDTTEKLDIKGFESERRDNPIFLKNFLKHLIDLTLRENDIAAAERHVRSLATKIVENELTIDDYTITKNLTKKNDEYNDWTAIEAAIVADKVRSRGDGSYQVGDRVAYVITESNSVKVAARAECSNYVKSSGGRDLKIDRIYYIEKLFKPLETLFKYFQSMNSTIENFLKRECVSILQRERNNNKCIVFDEDGSSDDESLQLLKKSRRT